MSSHSAHDPHSAQLWLSSSYSASSFILSYPFTVWGSLFYLRFAHLNSAAAHFTILVSKMMMLTQSTLIFCLLFLSAVSLSVSTPLIAAWAQLKQFPYPSAHGLWWQLSACEVPARGLHYALLQKTWFDLTRFYFEGPSLKNSQHRPVCCLSFFSSSSHNPRPKRGEKYVDLIFTWLHGAHTGTESVLTLCETRRFSCKNKHSRELTQSRPNVWSKMTF